MLDIYASLWASNYLTANSDWKFWQEGIAYIQDVASRAGIRNNRQLAYQ